MKNVFKRMPVKLMAAVATVALVAGVASQAIAGFGPDRPTRAWNQDGVNGFDHVTFNSFTGVPNGIGDERDFLRGQKVGNPDSWSDPVTGVTNQQEVEVKIYIHNNASSSLNESGDGIAKDVKVRAELPSGFSQNQELKSFISASNAKPTQEIYDTLNLTGVNEGFFNINYVPGSAQMFNHETGQTTAISDSLVTTGVNLPDQKGCFEYVREITFRVVVNMPGYKTQKTARLKGEDSTKWRKVVNAKVGDEVEWRIWFANSGVSQLEDVILVDTLPSHTSVVGKVEMDKGPSTVAYNNDVIQNGGKTVHLSMGNFAPGDDAYVYITTKIMAAEILECGVHQIVNAAYTTPKGVGALVDTARVNVFGKEDCDEPTSPSYVCESLTVEKIGGRKVRVTVKAPASNGATFKHISLNYGDGSTAKVTNQLVNEYEYAKDGTYKVSATAVFTVNGEDKTVSSEACAANVTFGTTPTPELPKTGTGSMIALFSIVTLAAAAAHSFISRRIA